MGTFALSGLLLRIQLPQIMTRSCLSMLSRTMQLFCLYIVTLLVVRDLGSFHSLESGMLAKFGVGTFHRMLEEFLLNSCL